MQKRKGLVEVIPYPCPRIVQGLIQIAPDLETLFGEPPTTPPPKTVINLDRARAHWKTAARARKAAEALLAADLADLAQPHMQAAAQTALSSLHILHGIAPDAPFESEPYGPNAPLAQALYEHVVPEGNFTGEPSPEVINLFGQLDKQLLEKK